MYPRVSLAIELAKNLVHFTRNREDTSHNECIIETGIFKYLDGVSEIA